MGRSPGKWIKTLVCGKNMSKSSLGKKSAMSEKGETVSSRTPSLVSDTTHFSADRQKKDLENGTEDQQEQAVITAQAILRGYLARRSFRAIKGIVRLQALVHGHLVRRQAVSTLRCVRGIIALQSLARGKRVRASVTGLQLRNKLASRDLSGFSTAPRQDKLSTHAFACKLMASSRSAIPLRCRYDPNVPNSSWQWLERWSSSKLWGPNSQTNNKSKKNKDTTDHKKTPRKKAITNFQIKKSDLNRLKQVEERVSNLNNRKLLSELINEKQPINELERVKQTLRRISGSSSSKSADRIVISPPIVQQPVIPEKNEDKIIQIDEEVKDTSRVEEIKILPRKLDFSENNNNVPRIKSPLVPNYMNATKSTKAKLRGFGSPRFEKDERLNNGELKLRRHSMSSFGDGKSSLISPRSENRPLVQSSADGYVSGKIARPSWRR